MFSHERRCIYRNHQLVDVICQLRFPEILTISTTIPDRFQEAIRREFPQYTKRQELPGPKFAGTPGNMALQKPEPIVNHQFSSADGLWRINLTSQFLSLSCSRYTCWEEFAGKLDQPLTAFIKIYQPAYFQRAGLRYVNFISRNDLQLSDVPFRELIEPCYLGPLAEEDVLESACSRCSIDTEVGIRGGCRVKIHAGPGMIARNGKTDKEVKFILDLDVFMPGQIPMQATAGALQTLHSQAWPVFRGAVTEKLHNAMDPD